MAPRAKAKASVARRPAAAAAVVKRPAATKVVVAKRPAGAGTKRDAGRGTAIKRPAGADSGADKKDFWKKYAQTASKVQGMYYEMCEFPTWSLGLLAKGQLDEYAKSVVVYHSQDDDLEKVKQMTKQREPANVGMTRCYDEDAFEALTGHRHGAYAESTEDELMPNIAIYCRTPMQAPSGERLDVHVINLVGYAFDSQEQPDWQYFLPLDATKWDKLVSCMAQMWQKVYECARDHSLKRVYLADVGGGAFSGGLEASGEEFCYQRLKEASLPPVQQMYDDIETEQLPRIPDFCFSAEGRSLLADSLLVNAWDPWSLVGNANRGDNSLDGFFGRCTAMAVLCWPATNPHITWKPISKLISV